MCLLFFERKQQKQEKTLRTKSILIDYVNEGYSNRQLSIQKNKKEYLVRKYIQNQLDANRLQVIDIIYEKVKYIMVDVYHLPGGQVFLVYYEFIIQKVIWFSIGDGETKNLIEADLKLLKNSFGYDIKVCILDGSKKYIQCNEICIFGYYHTKMSGSYSKASFSIYNEESKTETMKTIEAPYFIQNTFRFIPISNTF